MIEQGKHDIRCILQQADGTAWEVASIGDISISMSKNTATSLSGTLYRDNNLTPAGSESLIVLLDGEVFMWIYLEEISKGEEHIIKVSGIDQLKFLVKNERTQNYGELSVGEYTRRVLADLNAMNTGDIDDSGFILPEIVMQQTKVLDQIIDCINKTYENTGEKFFLYDEGHKINLRNQENMRIPESDFMVSVFNTSSYSWGENVKDIYTSVKAYTQEENLDDEKTKTAEDSEAISRHGFMQKEITVQDGEDPLTVARTTLEGLKNPQVSLKVSGVFGDTRVRPGTIIYVDLYSYNSSKTPDPIIGWYEVESCSHNLSTGAHFMDLDLTLVE